MKVMIIGDIHGDLKKIEKIPIKGVDLILLTGDIGKSDLLRNLAFKHIKKEKSWKFYENPKKIKEAYREVYDSYVNVLNFLSKYAPTYLIFGNVEWEDSEVPKEIKMFSLKKALKDMKKVHLINNKVICFKDKKIVGVKYFVEDNWVKTFIPKNERRFKKAKKETEKTKKFLNKIGKTDILLCHQPPYKILDKVTAKFAPKQWQGKHAGSKVILDYIKRKQPRYVFCGHIHEGEGTKKIGKTEVYNLGTTRYKIIEI